jgi:hypothetical protein
MQNGTATGARDLGSEDSQSQAPQPPIQNGTDPSPSSAQIGNHHPAVGAAAAADEVTPEADNTSVEDDVSAGAFDPGSSASAEALEVDPDAHGEEDRGDSVYAYSTYPRIQAHFQVEHPFDTMPDSATM